MTAGILERTDITMNESLRHDPVMLREVLEWLALNPGDVVVDGTLGLAGHSLRFLELIGEAGTLVATDWDLAMLEEAKARMASFGARQVLVNSDYRQLPTILDELNLKADAVLLDLGLNSAQISDPERGITFSQEGPLDMRMDRSRGETAAAMLNRMSPNEIEQILFDLGDERWAKAIAKAIVSRRKDHPLRTTADLVDAVLEAVPPKARDRRIHPATRTFQAVRIAVNAELEDLTEAIEEIGQRLAFGGRIVVLSYHSGEDRCTKHAFRALADTGEFEDETRKPIGPSVEEISRNPRSRSAKLRCLRRIA